MSSMFGDPSKALPLQGIMESIMRGNAEAAAQTQVKKTAADQAEGNADMKLAFTGKKTTGGVPIVKFEGPADALNGTQQEDLAKSYQAPKDNVDRAIARMRQNPFEPKPGQTGDQPQPQPEGQPGPPATASGVQPDAIADIPARRDQVNAALGFTGPQTQTRVSPQDIAAGGWKARYNARRELGGNVIGSALFAGIEGGLRDKKLAQDLQNERTDLANRRYISQGIPQEREALAQQREGLAKQRLGSQQQKATDTENRNFIHGYDWLPVEPGHEVDEFMSAKGLSRADAERYAPWILKEANNQRRAAAEKNYQRSIDEKDALSIFPSYDKVIEALGPAPDKTKENQRQARWQAQHQDRLDKEKKVVDLEEWRDRRAEQTDRRIAMAIAKSNKETPYKLKAHEIEAMSTDALLKRVGDSDYHQPTVRQALDTKRGELNNQLADIDAKMRGNSDQHDKIAPMIYDKDPKTGQWVMNERKARGSTFDLIHVTNLENKNRELAEKAVRVRGELAKLDAGATTQPTTVTYGAKEPGIAAYMKAAGVDRPTAITALKKAGRL